LDDFHSILDVSDLQNFFHLENAIKHRIWTCTHADMSDRAPAWDFILDEFGGINLAFD
jgi:hypothetical protein